MAFIQLPKANVYFFMCLAGQEKNKLGVTFKHVKTKVKKGRRPFFMQRHKKWQVICGSN